MGVTVRFSALLLVLAGAGAQAGTWSNLWFTPEQQGQRQLEAGHAREAAKMFSDPRRRGYAELEAKDYGAAQRQLAPLPDAESQYNRGNALARAGNLRSALDAYDASLKHQDADAALRRDARHNRDLVAKQLEQQNRHPQGSQGGNPQGDKSQRDHAGQDPKGQPRNGQPDAKESAQSNAGNQGQSSKANESQVDGSRQNGQQQAPGSQNGEGQDQEAAKADAQQAQRDAAQALEQSRRSARNPPQPAQNATKTTGGDAEKEPAQSQPAEPPSEQSLALDQWLRQIPDDPGGLLRRKFLIEHMIKQNAGGTP
jgi:Ca-activated chloride channel homolog